MKKLLLTITVIIGLASCNPNDVIIKGRRDKENLPVKYIYHFEYNGHDYILFRTSTKIASEGGVVHDPDCKCKANKK